MAENGPFGTPQKDPPERVCVGPFFASFPKEMRHVNFFLGVPKWGILGGGQKVYVEKVYVLFRSPIQEANRKGQWLGVVTHGPSWGQ